MTPTLDFFGQPFSDDETAAAFVTNVAEDTANESLTIVVAWARFGGLRRVKQALEDFRARGGEFRIILGIDEGGATRPGLMLARELATEAFVFHDPAGWTFHPKIYLAEGPNQAALLVGSSNATAGGLFGNYEASLRAEFDLPAEADHGALIKVRQYIERLLGEHEICVPLTQELIDELVASSRYVVAGHERRQNVATQQTQGDEAGEDIDSSGSTGDGSSGGALFGKRESWKSVPPPLSADARDELAALEIGVEDEAAGTQGPPPTSAGIASTPGPAAPAGTASQAAAEKRWYKRLSVADAQQLDPSTSSGTGAATLVQFGHPIDRATYFRHDLFGDVDWAAEEGEKETASVEFEVWINGASWGTETLVVVHDPSFESGQENRTTLLRWGSDLNEHLRTQDFSDDFLTLERLSDGSYRLTISQEEVGPFIA